MYKTRCARCKTWIQIGNKIVRDNKLKKFVHVSCRHVQERVVNAHAAAVAAEAAEEEVKDTTLPHGLSVRTLQDYQVEWDRYTKFAAEKTQEVPGRDVKWDMKLLWQYMQFRATTCKPTTIVQIATKLRHFGIRHGYVLATSKFDAKPSEYGTIKNMKRQLSISAREQAQDSGTRYTEVGRCTPVGKRSVEMLLSAFAVVGRDAFRRLSRANRHHLFSTVMQHTGGMRFGNVLERDYTTDSFVRDARDGSFRLVTDYSRYAGQRQFCIVFEESPRFESMYYHVSKDGMTTAVLTAATIMGWHFEVLQENGERHVFRPVRGELTSRDSRQKWLRQALFDALPLQEYTARKLVNDVTPHSFRAGLAGDLYREGIAFQVIGSVCRWNSAYAMRIYSERPCLSMSRTSDDFRAIAGDRS